VPALFWAAEVPSSTTALGVAAPVCPPVTLVEVAVFDAEI
jgi:hypothetical protein